MNALNIWGTLPAYFYHLHVYNCLRKKTFLQKKIIRIFSVYSSMSLNSRFSFT